MVADVTIVGTGVIGLSAAVELADRGVRVRLVGTAHRGEASVAAGGMLAPSVEREMALDPAHHFALAARDRFPGYLNALEARTRIPVPVNRLGILQVAQERTELERMYEEAGPGAKWLDAAGVLGLEPSLAGVVGGVFHPHDGCVDPLLLLDALRLLASRHERITVTTEDVREIRLSSNECSVGTDRENWYGASAIVLAAGAWVGRIGGIPRPLPVEPMRGQMVAFGAAPVRHVVFGGGGYLIPKADGTTVVGSTMERVGFDPETTDAGLKVVRGVGVTLCPSLADAPVSAYWAGLRPVTPDFLPIIGRDPSYERLIYACGHSRNGILLAPLTAEVVGDLVLDQEPRHDLSRFRPDRF